MERRCAAAAAAAAAAGGGGGGGMFRLMEYTRTVPLMYSQEGGYCRWSTMNIPNTKGQDMEYTREGGYQRWSTMNMPIMKSHVLGEKTLMHPLKGIGFHRFSTFSRPVIKRQVQLLKESLEKLILYAKTVSIPISKQAKCLVFEAVRTVWLFATGLVWEYFRHVRKGFEDFVSQHHFVSFLAIISSFMVYLIEKFNLSSYVGFHGLFKDVKESALDALAKEMRDIESKLNEQAELSEQYLQTLTEVASGVQMTASEVSGLKVRADMLEVCVKELQNELMKLKGENENK